MAQVNLGSLYRHGQGVTQDYELAVHWFRRATEQGLAWAEFVLGEMYADGLGVDQDNDEAIRWFRRAAEQGHEQAKATLEALER